MLTKTGNALKLFKSPTIYWKKKKKGKKPGPLFGS